MAKKKKSQRKRNFAYSSTQAQHSQPRSEQVSTQETAKPNPRPSTTQGIGQSKLAYIRHDIKTIMVLALVCVGLELVLWYLLHHTGLGSIVFGG